MFSKLSILLTAVRAAANIYARINPGVFHLVKFEESDVRPWMTSIQVKVAQGFWSLYLDLFFISFPRSGCWLPDELGQSG